MAIKNKSRDPKSTDFTKKDLVINVKEGTLFYKDNKKLYRLKGDDLSTAVTESNLSSIIQDINGNIINVGEGNISSSNFISNEINSGFANIEKLYLPGQGIETMKVGSSFAIGETLEVVGNINSTGTIYAHRFESSGSATSIDVVDNLDVTGNITASGDIRATSLYITASGQSVIQVGNTGNTLSKWEFHRNGTRRWGFYNDGRTSQIVPQDSFVFKHGTDSDGNDYINMSLSPSTQGVWCHGDITASGDMSISGSIIPEGSGSYNLGSNTNPWNQIHVMSSSIHFYDDDGEIGRLSYVKNEGLRISDETDSPEGVTSTIDGGSF